MLRDILMILFTTCMTLGGQFLLKHGVVRIAALTPKPAGIDWLMAVAASPAVWGAVLLQGIGFVVWIVVISRVKLGMAFAIAGAFLYIMMAMGGWFLYGERLTPLQWTGIVLISAGVAMISTIGHSA